MKFTIYCTKSAEAEPRKEEQKDVLRGLTPIGRQQAKMRGSYFAGKKVYFDFVFCSPSVRSTMTAQHIIANNQGSVLIPKTIHALYPSHYNVASYLIPKLEDKPLGTYNGSPESNVLRTYAQKCVEAIMSEIGAHDSEDKTELTVLIVGDGILLNYIALWLCDMKSEQSQMCLERILKPADYLQVSCMF